MDRKSRREKDAPQREFKGASGFLDSITQFVEKLGELAEKGESLRKSGEIGGPEGKVRGVYGLSIKFGLDKEGLKVEPFGNIRRDEQTGRPVVSEIREPVVDVFNEDTHVLVVAEMPGVGEGDLQLDLKGDILTIAAARGEKKYRKEVLLPRSFTRENMTHACNNGVVEIKLRDKSL